MQPWFKFYAADYLLDSDVDRLPLEAQAILVRLWCLAWRDGFIPVDLPVLARRTQVDLKVLRRHFHALAAFFPDACHEGLQSRRMESERQASLSDSEARRRGAATTNAKRWGQRQPSESPSDRSATTERVAERVGQRVADESVSESDSEVLVPPPTPPVGGEPAGKRSRRRGKAEAPDCSEATRPHVDAVYALVPKLHPCTREEVHRGPLAEARRAAQRLVDAGTCTPEDVEWVGRVYYTAEALEAEFPEVLAGLVAAVNDAWDTRKKAMMHVSTLFGPQKKPYAQLLGIARKAMQRTAHLRSAS